MESGLKILLVINQQFFINYCALIRKSNLTDDYGIVWKSKKDSNGNADDTGFFLGLGTLPGKQIRSWQPISKWEECYFAKELPQSPDGENQDPEQDLQFLKSLV